MIQSRALTFRTIRPNDDAALAAANYRDAHFASYGAEGRYQGDENYVTWLRERVEEYPDGHVLAFFDEACVGQLELQVPYGLTTGYVNLFYVTPPFRQQGYGRLLHDFAERYFRSWEAARIELDVTRTNHRAINFYRHLGYRVTRARGFAWRMAKALP